MEYVVLMILWISCGVAALMAILSVWGLYLKRVGQLPFDEDMLQSQGGSYVLASDGRRIEYCTYGHPDKDSPVVINLHASGMEAQSEKHFYDDICRKLGIRGISISLPGHGFSDIHPGRVVRDWPKEDLTPILEQEQVDTFMVTGHSQGTAHALAAAWFFPRRCTAMGLNAPFLPVSICRAYSVSGALAMEQLPRTKTLQKPYAAAYFAIYYIGVKLIVQWFPTASLKAFGPQIHSEKKLVRIMTEGLTRSTIRGIGSVWESTFDVCFEWGFDLREIQTQNICIWHAQDDNACPPEHGAILRDIFQEKGRNVNFQNTTSGFGHFTFNSEHYLKPENSIIKAMLDGVRHD